MSFFTNARPAPPVATVTSATGAADDTCDTTDEMAVVVAEDPRVIVTEFEPFLKEVTNGREKHHCELSRKAIARNVVGVIASSAIGAAATAGGGFVAAAVVKAAATSAKVSAVVTETIKGGAAKGTSMKLGVGMPLPQLWKCAEYMGYQHIRNMCVVPEINEPQHILKVVDKGKSWNGTVKRGTKEVTGGDFCAVWGTLSWDFDEPVNAVRITIVPSTVGDNASVSYTAEGAVSTRLVLEEASKMFLHIRVETCTVEEKVVDGKKVKVNVPNRMKEVKLPVMAFDRVEYVWCGFRPSQTTWHVSYANYRPVYILPKPEIGKSYKLDDKLDLEGLALHHTGHMGVVNSDLVLARQDAERARVYVDGTFGNGTQPPKVNAAKDAAKTWSVVNLIKSGIRAGVPVPNDIRRSVAKVSSHTAEVPVPQSQAWKHVESVDYVTEYQHLGEQAAKKAA